jgi:hypothetical protein
VGGAGHQEIGAFIVQDLLTGPQAAGSGFKHQTKENAYFFFDREEKMLMALESTDFYCYMRERFGLAKKDFEEFKDFVKRPSGVRTRPLSRGGSRNGARAISASLSVTTPTGSTGWTEKTSNTWTTAPNTRLSH